LQELCWPAGGLVEVLDRHLYVLLQQLCAVFEVMHLLLLLVMLMVMLLFVLVLVLLLQVVHHCS
jgi:hypothetical protein